MLGRNARVTSETGKEEPGLIQDPGVKERDTRQHLGDTTKLEGPAFVGSVWRRPRRSSAKLR